MRTGYLNNRVTIMQPSATQDTVGQPILTFTELATVWADIRHKSGLESIKADAETSVVKASMRAVHGDVTYEIKAVLPDERERDKIDLLCEVVNDG